MSENEREWIRIIRESKDPRKPLVTSVDVITWFFTLRVSIASRRVMAFLPSMTCAMCSQIRKRVRRASLEAGRFLWANFEPHDIKWPRN